MKISGYAALNPKDQLKPIQYELKKLGPLDVSICVTHCGICRSDIHLIDNDWGSSVYPLVAGHEVIGTIAEVGSQVSRIKEGDRVGVGWQAGSCTHCEWCLNSDENLCANSKAVCTGNHGGFGSIVVVDWRFAIPIPKSLRSEGAAPLLCGGVTVYSPLKRYVTPNMKVGVVGFGGLGHLAVQFADSFGCEVTVFSTSKEKEKDALSLGTDHFILSQENKAMSSKKSTLDFIISTVSADLDWELYMGFLKNRGRFCIVGASPGEIKLQPFTFIGGEKSFCGSVIGSPATISEMLEFAADHQIEARTELVPLAEVNQAIDRVRKNQARYRMVLQH